MTLAKWKDAGDALTAFLPVILGLAVLALFGFFVDFLARNVNASDTAWTRFTFLFTAVQSVAMLAATFFFGKSISTEQQKSADAKAKAKTSAKDLDDLANQAARLEARFRVPDLDAAANQFIELKGGAASAVPDFVEHLRATHLSDVEADAAEIANLAERARRFADQAKVGL